MSNERLLGIDSDDLIAELKRRKAYFDNVTIDELRSAAKAKGEHLRPHRNRPPDRTVALWITGLATLLLLAAIIGIAVSGNDVPDVLSGLAGSGMGGVIGLLTAPSLSSEN